MKKLIKINGYTLIINKYYLLIIICFLSCGKRKEGTSDTKIKKLENLNEIYQKDRFTEKGKVLAYNLRDEALKQKNDKYTGLSYYYMGLDLSFTYPEYIANKDSTLYYFLLAKQYSKKAGDKKGEMMSDYQMAKIYTWEGNLGLTLNLIKPLLKSAEDSNDSVMIIQINKLLSKIYLLLNNPDEAYRRADEGYKALKKAPDYNAYNADLFELVFEKGSSLYYKKEYNKSLSYCDTLQGFFQKNISSNPNQVIYYQYILDELKIINLIETEKLNHAIILINQLKIYQDKYPALKEINLTNWNFLNAKYYFKLRKYSKTLEYLDFSLSDNLFKQLNIVDYINIYELKADTYAAQNNYAAATSTKKELNQYLDSINKINFIDQINNLRNIENIEKLIIENQNNKEKLYYTNFIISLLSIIGILLLLTFYIINRNLKELKSKNKQIFRQYKNLDKYTATLHDVEHNYDSQNLNSTDQILFEKIETYLQSSKLFLNPEITREALALELGTNREYLIKTIHKYTGKTFKEYINDKRLEYSRHLLSYSKDLSIDDIYILCGFSSKKKYFHLFENKYNLTPKELRDIAAESEIETD
ncbi:helix-turn-helix domain-containing protein [Dysgonomonas macrotermitis]|nr:helix-turn-helix domain-containing protein [Dysgonomonas macrotermitis]